MGFLQAKLIQLENRLQALVEGSAARLIPFRGEQDGLPRRLAQAMQAGLRREADGSLLAPNLFTLTLHPAYARLLEEDAHLLGELAGAIRQAGREAGLRFLVQPTIKIAADEGVPPRQVSIRAEICSQQLDETSTLAIAPEGAPPQVPPNAYLIVDASQVFPLSLPAVNIGRSGENHLILDDPRVSRAHAQLRCTHGYYVIFDLDSTGGTFVNGQRIRQYALRPGDVISLAGVTLVYGQDGGGASGSAAGGTHPVGPLPWRD